MSRPIRYIMITMIVGLTGAAALAEDRPARIDLPEVKGEELTDFRLPKLKPDPSDEAAEPVSSDTPNTKLPAEMRMTGVEQSEPGEGETEEPAWEPTLGDLRTLRQLNLADTIFIATLDRATQVTKSEGFPPVYSYVLRFGEPEVLFGQAPENLRFTVKITSINPPDYVAGRRMMVAMIRSSVDNEPQLLVCSATDDRLEGLARLAMRIPAGWTLNAEGRPLSPWRELGDEAWPEKVGLRSSLRCAETGRPALLVPTGVTFHVEPLIEAGVRQTVNPFGDGKFICTLTNTTDAPQVIPALLTDGEIIYWADSLLIAEGNQTFVLPWAGAIKRADPEKLRGIVLQPKQSVQTVVNVLAVTGVSWPRSRASMVVFTFGIGDRAVMSHFYYRTEHHDPLRLEVLSRLGLDRDRSRSRRR